MDDRLAAHLERARPGLSALARETLRSADEADRVVLATLAPAERLGHALHVGCAMPLAEVAALLGRSETATRQLASRARRRLASPEVSLDAERVVHGRVVDAFLTAAAAEDVEELAWLLHADATLWADAPASADVVGADAVAETFARLAEGAGPAVLDGFAAAVQPARGSARAVVGFTVVEGRIAHVEVLTDRGTIARCDLGPAAH